MVPVQTDSCGPHEFIGNVPEDDDEIARDVPFIFMYYLGNMLVASGSLKKHRHTWTPSLQYCMLLLCYLLQMLSQSEGTDVFGLRSQQQRSGTGLITLLITFYYSQTFDWTISEL